MVTNCVKKYERVAIFIYKEDGILSYVFKCVLSVNYTLITFRNAKYIYNDYSKALAKYMLLIELNQMLP